VILPELDAGPHFRIKLRRRSWLQLLGKNADKKLLRYRLPQLQAGSTRHLADVICTSGNADKIVRPLRMSEHSLGPDQISARG